MNKNIFINIAADTDNNSVIIKFFPEGQGKIALTDAAVNNKASLSTSVDTYNCTFNHSEDINDALNEAICKVIENIYPTRYNYDMDEETEKIKAQRLIKAIKKGVQYRKNKFDQIFNEVHDEEYWSQQHLNRLNSMGSEDYRRYCREVLHENPFLK